MLSEESRKRLCEWKGDCWHEPDGPYAVGVWRRKEYPFDHGMVFQRCTKCRRLLSTSEQEYVSNPAYTDWNSVNPLLAKIAADGEWDAWFQFVMREYKNQFALIWRDVSEGSVTKWMLTKPEHTAGLVDKWLERKEEGK